VWLQHSISTAPSRKVLFNRHTGHAKNAETLDLAHEHGLIMLALPGHCYTQIATIYLSLPYWCSQEMVYEVLPIRSCRHTVESVCKNCHSEHRIKCCTYRSWPVDWVVSQSHCFLASSAVLGVDIPRLSCKEFPSVAPLWKEQSREKELTKKWKGCIRFSWSISTSVGSCYYSK
jgi:hypothetical protein